MANQKQKYQDFGNTNPLEIAKGAAQGVAETAIDLMGGIGKTALDQIGLTPRKPQESSEIKMGQPSVIELTKRADAAEKKVEQLQNKFFNKVSQETQVLYDRKNEQEQAQVKQLLMALKQEAESIRNQAASLTGEVKNITVSSANVEGNKYSLNFFVWVLEMLRDIKKDIIKSRTWLSAFNSKKNKKGYWAMFKKHGTSFAMSDERGLATASG